MKKEEEGLDIRHLSQLNQATLAKVGWKLLIEDGLYGKKLHFRKYCKEDGDSLSMLMSYTWRSIEGNAEVVTRQGMRWRLGNGETIGFWID